MRVDSGKEKPRWSSGFVIGAEGEIVFGIDKIPNGTVKVIADDNSELAAEVLGYDLGLSLAVARITTKRNHLALTVSERPGLFERSWVVSLTHDARGRAQPYAGVVDTALEQDTKRKTPIKVLVAQVSVPGELGAPVLSTTGELVGVVIEKGDRKTRVVPFDIVAPFVKAVVVGRDAR